MSASAAPGNQSTVSIFEFDVGGKLLGTGSFSEVVIAKRYKDNKKYAIKQVNKFHAQRKNVVKYVVNERRVLLSINHPSIVKLNWTSRDEQNVYMIYEYLCNGELWEMLQKFEGKVVPLDLAKHWLAEVVLALEYLHQRGIAHRDLKPENIMLDESFHLRVIDFGTCKVLNELPLEAKHKQHVLKAAEMRADRLDQERKKKEQELAAGEGKEPAADADRAQTPPPTFGPAEPLPSNVSFMSEEEHRRKSILYSTHRLNSFTGTPEYMAPEVVNSKPVPGAGAACDLWSLGIMMFQFLTGALPFTGGSAYLVFQATLKGDIAFPESMPADAVSLVRSLLVTNPLDRPGVATSALAVDINPILDTAAGTATPPAQRTAAAASARPAAAASGPSSSGAASSGSSSSPAAAELSSKERYLTATAVEQIVKETSAAAEASGANTFTAIKGHPFFAGINWDTLLTTPVPRLDELKALARKLTPEEAKAAASRKREGEKVTIEDLEKEFQKVDDEDLMNEADGLEHVLERIELTDVERLTQQQQAAGTSEPVIELVDDTGNVVRPDD